jgi:hypothetical protein
MTNVSSNDIKLLLKLYNTQQIKSAEERELKAYEIVKKAAVGGLSLANIASLAKKIPKSNFGKGLALGAGVAIPGYIAGKHLIDYGTDQARNKALQVAGGAAAIGTALYGLHRMMASPQKQAMDSYSTLEDTINKIASASYLDTLLETGSLDTALTKEGCEQLDKINKRYLGSLILSLIN